MKGLPVALSPNAPSRNLAKHSRKETIRKSPPKILSVNNVRTVSDTKRDFYSYHTRPINSIYRRVVEELMVEMHLLSVNVDFRYDPIYALGVVTSFDRFMQGYLPERDKESIFEAVCQALGEKTEKYRHDAEQLKEVARRLSGESLINWLKSPTPVENSGNLHEIIGAISQKSPFKYSRLFAIGLFTLLEVAQPEVVKDEKQRAEALKEMGEALHLPEEKFQKDLEFYRSNLEKMAQVQVAMADALQAERKKREKRAQEKAQVAAPSPGTPQEIQPNE